MLKMSGPALTKDSKQRGNNINRFVFQNNFSGHCEQVMDWWECLQARRAETDLY